MYLLTRGGECASLKPEVKRELMWLVFVGSVLIAAVLLIRGHDDVIKRFIDAKPVLGMFLYIVLNILDALVAPGATLPLIPVAVHAWGRVGAALVTTAGWTAGSLLAFLIARRWGYPVVRKVVSRERLQRLSKAIPDDLFWSVVLLRLVMPMDVMSYVLGLLTDMTWPKYVIATALGLAAPAMVLAWLGKLPYAYEFIMLGVATVVGVGIFLITRRRTRSNGTRRAKGMRHAHSHMRRAHS